MSSEARTNRTNHTRAKFLEKLAETCNVSKSCELSGLARQTAYEWKADDPDFAAAWEKALSIGADKLEEEAIRRAYEGYDKPVYQSGQLVGIVREYSDTLMCLLLKGRKRAVFGDKVQQELSGPEGGPIQAAVTVEFVKPKTE